MSAAAAVGRAMLDSRGKKTSCFGSASALLSVSPRNMLTQRGIGCDANYRRRIQMSSGPPTGDAGMLRNPRGGGKVPSEGNSALLWHSKSASSARSIFNGRDLSARSAVPHPAAFRISVYYSTRGKAITPPSFIRRRTCSTQKSLHPKSHTHLLHESGVSERWEKSPTVAYQGGQISGTATLHLCEDDLRKC
jgi:hypothetical protein